MNCPKCTSDNLKKNGKGRKGQQCYRCQECGKKFSEAVALGECRTDIKKAAFALQCLLEGCSIRATSRLTSLDKDTIQRLMERAGEQCRQFLDQTVTGVQAEAVQCDEVWSFVGAKEKTAFLNNMGAEVGDAYVFTAIERTSKLLICYHIGRRSSDDADMFAHKLAGKIATERPHISTDGYTPYRFSIPDAFKYNVDHGVVVKSFGTAGGSDARRYSPAAIIGVKHVQNVGRSVGGQICTSHIERSNLTVRMQNRRFTRLTNAFSKKWENHEAMFALFAAWYNFCRRHQTLKTTPAVAAGLTAEAWSLERLLAESAKAMAA